MFGEGPKILGSLTLGQVCYTLLLFPLQQYYQYRDRFVHLNYPRFSQTFYKRVITVLKLATTPLHHTITIQKLNNIIINCFQNPRPSILPNKWQFDTSQDSEVLEDNFDSVSLDTIPDGTLRALNFYFSLLGYFEERAPWFVNVTNNRDLTIEPVDNNQTITEFEDEKMRKQNKRAAKRKARLDKLSTPMRTPVASSAALLSSRPTLVSCHGSSAPLSSCLRFLTRLLSCPMPAPVPRSPAVLLPLHVLGSAPLHLVSSTLRIFKQALSNELLRRRLTSPAELFCLFPLLGSLSDKTDYKQTLDISFINSCLLVDNHTREEVDMSFTEYSCSAAVKQNRLW